MAAAVVDRPPEYLPPPAYQSLPPAHQSRHLPPYDCTVTFSAHVLVKPEYETPTVRSRSRPWQPVHALLEGTKLHLHSPQGTTILSTQAGDVGLALDYHTRSFVLRLRLEGRQFLLASGGQAGMMRFYSRLCEAVAIALPLEQREEPKQGGVPWKRVQVAVSPVDLMRRRWREREMRRSKESEWLDRDGETPEKRKAWLGRESTRDIARELLSCNEGPEDNSSAKMDIKVEDSGEMADLKHAHRCARVLYYNAAWSSSWYLRDGKAVEVPQRARVCLDDLFGLRLYTY